MDFSPFPGAGRLLLDNQEFGGGETVGVKKRTLFLLDQILYTF